MRTAGFVLVGGKSLRMGQDKALLLWHLQPLVQRIAATVAAVAGTVTLVGQPQRYTSLSLPCLPDRRDDLGPLAGIEAALETGQGEWNLIVSCDMPSINIDVLRCLLDKAGQTNALCIAVQDMGGQIHPLCAVYHSQCLPVIRKALDAGDLKLMRILEELQADYLPVQTKLSNINTPEDWLHWQQLG